MSELTHLDSSGRARMVDVGAKQVTERRAVAQAIVRVSPETAAAAAALTVYDMVKGLERGAEIASVVLLEKAGGKSGHWQRDAGR